MLVTLDQMKTYLKIDLPDTTYDEFLTYQIEVVSEAIEGYCGRKFNSASYTQTFYKDEMLQLYRDNFPLFHYPVSAITSVTEDEEAISADETRLQKERGYLKRTDSGIKKMWFYNGVIKVAVVYSAGYAEIPSTITQTVYSLVAEKYNKEISGINIDFGSDVQSISIPGTLTINFDYTLQANDRTTKFGMIIGNYANVLDPYRSERAVIGSVEDYYVE